MCIADKVSCLLIVDKALVCMNSFKTKPTRLWTGCMYVSCLLFSYNCFFLCIYKKIPNNVHVPTRCPPKSESANLHAPDTQSITEKQVLYMYMYMCNTSHHRPDIDKDDKDYMYNVHTQWMSTGPLRREESNGIKGYKTLCRLRECNKCPWELLRKWA